MEEPIWLGVREAHAIHDLQLAEHGGGLGLRDSGLLESALARPQQLFAYGEPDLFDLAAAYTEGIVRNHPFVDGNKSTGFVLGVLFLELNGVEFAASEEGATQAVLDLAASELAQDEYASWLRTVSSLEP